MASDEQETSEVHVSDIYVYDGEKWILLINSTREIAVDDYVDHTYQSTNPVENQAIAREIDTKHEVHIQLDYILALTLMIIIKYL